MLQLQLSRATELDCSRAGDSLAHGGRVLSPARAHQRRDLDWWNRNVDVQAVEQRARETRAVALTRRVRATTAQARMPEVAASAGVDRGDQQRAGWKTGSRSRPRDVHEAVLERLTQCLERRAAKLCQFIQEQHAVMGEADLARARDIAATD